MPDVPAFEGAAEALDFDSVLSLVAGRCQGERAREFVRAAEISADAGWIRARLDENDEMKRVRLDGDVSVGDTAWIEDAERIANRPETADGESLRRIAEGERTAGRARADVGAVDPPVSRLSRICDGVHVDSELVDDIERAFDADGELRDDASVELAGIRKKLSTLRVRIREGAEKLARSFGGDAHTTLVGTRHVLVVPRREIRRGSGVVHASSQSGESLYFEPPRLVALNNDVETLVGEERAERSRILRLFGERVHRGLSRMRANARAVEALDVIRARVRFGEVFRCTRPQTNAEGAVKLPGARHPILENILSRVPGGSLVPLDIEIATGERVLVITGPNAGGKTVALKTLGLCSLLHQSGLDVPCDEGAVLPVFGRVFVDVGDGQSMESSLSTFTSHLEHVNEMLRGADDRSLCLVDEIGQGTDPDEGAAIAIAALEALRDTGAAVVATTHFGRIKAFALSSPGVANASMAFDDEDGRPLYRLLLGIAGRSRGVDTAHRVGMDASVVRRARELQGDEAFALDDVLSRLERERRAFESKRKEYEAQTDELTAEIARYRGKRGEYELTRRQAERRALREAREVLEGARRDVERVVENIRRSKADRASIREARETISRRLEGVVRKLDAPDPAARPLDSVRVGSVVSVSPSGSPVGEVVETDGARALVEINGKRITLPVGRLFPPVDGGTPSAIPADDERPPAVEFEPLTQTEVDLRGLDRESALSTLQKYLDRAALTGVIEIVVIHGVGTGVLARAVRDALRDDPRIESFREGAQVEGGAGVTIVRFLR